MRKEKSFCIVIEPLILESMTQQIISLTFEIVSPLKLFNQDLSIFNSKKKAFVLPFDNSAKLLEQTHNSTYCFAQVWFAN